MTHELEGALNVLKLHHQHFFQAQKFADETLQPTPEDSRAWSQILISKLTGIQGLSRHKGQDLADGSDVKSANAWSSIDKVRFNSVIKAGTKSNLSDTIKYLDHMPFLFFVLWDTNPQNKMERVRIWVVRTQFDQQFRDLADRWYNLRAQGKIDSTNFQLHPPVNENNNTLTNDCGNLIYPLLLQAEWNGNEYITLTHNPEALENGECVKA